MKINLQMQHTPKPEAQVPSFVPPFVEHSSLEFYKEFTSKNLSKSCLQFLTSYYWDLNKIFQKLGIITL